MVVMSPGACPAYHSPIHRVVLSPTEHRTSMVFFFYPSFDSALPVASSSSSGTTEGEAKGLGVGKSDQGHMEHLIAVEHVVIIGIKR